ncbi:MAG TPA: hypothetical protein VJY85_02410 [Candidatus Limnocylindria bacterium]|nr:hypothetical protein [Candidatus Limnocylindria bacterium]
MSLILSILAGMLGSLFGSAARAGTAMARAQIEGEPLPDVNISGSPVAGMAGGVVGVVMGPKTAFWFGAVLGAAGMDRFDAVVLKRVGIDMDALVAKATEAAKQAQAAATDAGEAAEQRAVKMADSTQETASDAGDAIESAAEEAGPA